MSNPENFGPRCEDLGNNPQTKEYIDAMPMRENSGSLTEFCSSKNMGSPDIKSDTIPQPRNGYETLKDMYTNSYSSTSRKVPRCKKNKILKQRKYYILASKWNVLLLVRHWVSQMKSLIFHSHNFILVHSYHYGMLQDDFPEVIETVLSKFILLLFNHHYRNQKVEACASL